MSVTSIRSSKKCEERHHYNLNPKMSKFIKLVVANIVVSALVAAFLVSGTGSTQSSSADGGLRKLQQLIFPKINTTFPKVNKSLAGGGNLIPSRAGDKSIVNAITPTTNGSLGKAIAAPLGAFPSRSNAAPVTAQDVFKELASLQNPLNPLALVNQPLGPAVGNSNFGSGNSATLAFAVNPIGP